MIVVDPSSERSVNFFRRIVESVPPTLPTFVLLSLRDSAKGNKSQGELLVRAACLSSKTPVDLETAAADHTSPMEMDDANHAPLPTLVQGLDLLVLSLRMSTQVRTWSGWGETF